MGMKTWSLWQENLTKIFCKVALNPRDVENSGTIFGFNVSIHKKSAALLKILKKIENDSRALKIGT